MAHPFQVWDVHPRQGNELRGTKTWLGRIGAGTMATAAGAPAVEKETVEDLVDAMDSFVPMIPEEVTRFYLRQTGFHTDDDRLVKVITLATQKFAAEVAQESMQRCKWRRDAARGRERGDDKRIVLTTEDLTEALRDRGVSVVKPPYYT